MKVSLVGTCLALACAGTAAAAPKPFHESAATCATYASPAFVQQLTGLVGTPQKGPPGQCHFNVNGVKDAFQLSVHALAAPKAALAMAQQTYDVLAVAPATGQWLNGIGDKALLLTDAGLSGVYAARGSEFFALQWGPRSVTVTSAQAVATLKALMAKVPK